ncbi:hypothetical protein [Maritimibacter alexandrii]|uniref:hypothetical protein n=1 Tax=Maritimibacter alexandrii TaxID=2570355 RepID=UPI00110864C7|nr:hypothetical protein [Maritimibacter alexandrii]
MTFRTTRDTRSPDPDQQNPFVLAVDYQPDELPAPRALGEGAAGLTAGGVEPRSTPGLFLRIRRALGWVDRAAAGAITHGPRDGKARRRLRAAEHASAMLAADALDSLGPETALAIVGMHLRIRDDLAAEDLHVLANALSRRADEIERSGR